jgi:hypothetical protein
MAKVNLVALKTTFGRREGAKFSAPEGYAKVLVKLGIARRDEVDPPAEPEPARKKRTYKRRDMSAEGTGE